MAIALTRGARRGRMAERSKPASKTSAKTEAAQVRTYIAAQAPKARKALRAVRLAARATASGAVDGFSYRMPCLRMDGRPLVWYAAFKNHYSLFPMTSGIRAAHASALEGYATSEGTVRFPLEEPVPVALIKRLVRARLAELRASRRGSARRAPEGSRSTSA